MLAMPVNEPERRLSSRPHVRRLESRRSRFVFRAHGLAATDGYHKPIIPPPGFGLRQSSGAFGTAGRCKSGRGLCSMHASSRVQGNGESQRDSGTKPRVARNELPWVRPAMNRQPQRGCGHARCSHRIMPQPFQGWIHCPSFPRVARSSQPWASRRNPVGIGDPCKAQRGVPHSKTLARTTSAHGPNICAEREAACREPAPSRTDLQ